VTVDPQPESGSALPAPYESPWRLLRQGLIAVKASLVLSMRELWRRNGEGDLPRPLFWPTPLAPLFWPLLALLAALLLALLLLVAPWPRWPAPAAPASSVTAAPPVPDQSPPERAAADPVPAAAGLPAASETDPEPTPELFTETATDPTTDPTTELQSVLVLPADGERPLLEQLGFDDPQHRLSEARVGPDAGQLVLTLAPGWVVLDPADRQRQADQWLGQAEALGYERLRLEDQRGRALGDQARVGSGMILLAPPQPADDLGS
jgi:hypothetical protein